jgi:FMN reductase
LFSFFAALTIPTAVYASDGDFTATDDGAGHVVTDAGIRARLASAADELTGLIFKRVGDAETVVQPARAAQ